MANANLVDSWLRTDMAAEGASLEAGSESGSASSRNTDIENDLELGALLDERQKELDDGTGVLRAKEKEKLSRLLHISSWFEIAWPMGASSQQVKECIENLEKQPYIGKALRSEISDVKEMLRRDGLEVGNQPSSSNATKVSAVLLVDRLGTQPADSQVSTEVKLEMPRGDRLESQNIPPPDSQPSTKTNPLGNQAVLQSDSQLSTEANLEIPLSNCLGKKSVSSLDSQLATEVKLEIPRGNRLGNQTFLLPDSQLSTEANLEIPPTDCLGQQSVPSLDSQLATEAKLEIPRGNRWKNQTVLQSDSQLSTEANLEIPLNYLGKLSVPSFGFQLATEAKLETPRGDRLGNQTVLLSDSQLSTEASLSGCLGNQQVPPPDPQLYTKAKLEIPRGDRLERLNVPPPDSQLRVLCHRVTYLEQQVLLKQQDSERAMQRVKQLEQETKQLKQETKQLKQETKQLKQENKQLEREKLRATISNVLSKIEKATNNVYVQLLYLGGLSQAEASQVSQTESTTSTGGPQYPPSRKRKTMESVPSISERSVPPPAESVRLVSSIFSDIRSIDSILPGLCEPQVSSERLKAVAECIEAYLDKATFLTRAEECYEEKVAQGISEVRNMIRSQKDGIDSASRADAATSVVEPSPKAYFAPGAAAHETDGAQPWIQMLVEEIGGCWEPGSLEKASPLKNVAQREALIPGTKHRSKRFIDFVMRKEGRWEIVIFDDMLTVPLEVKPGCRKGHGPSKLLDEARDQVLSHLAKNLFIGFNFACYGVPCHSTGVIVCMGALRILHLRYENVGTVEAKLTLYQSEALPLMSFKNFQRWARSAPEKTFDELTTELYGSSTTEASDDCGIPKGMQSLSNLMDRPSKMLFGFSIDAFCDKILGCQLGFGATAVVVRRCSHDGDQSSIIKLSRYGLKTHIENESKILKKLAGSSGDGHKYFLPSIVDSEDIKNGKLQIMLGSVVTKLPAIELTPFGTSVSAYLSRLDDIDHGLGIVLMGISSALKHMHSEKIYHCDVTPKNMIIAGQQEPRAVLIDFSISRSFDTCCKGFLGTPNFVHRKIFHMFAQNKKEWKYCPEYDLAGLGFSLALFANNSIQPWNALYPLKASCKEHLCNEMDARLDAARQVVKKKVHETFLIHKMNDLLNFDIKWETKVQKGYPAP